MESQHTLAHHQQSHASTTSTAAATKGERDRVPSDSNSSKKDDTPDSYTNDDDIAIPSPVQNPDEAGLYKRESLEQNRKEEKGYRQDSATKGHEDKKGHWNTQLYTISYLILFAIFGTLARLGLQAITFYPGAPIDFSVLWANFGGSLFFGFLTEDRMLFREEWGTPKYHQEIEKAKRQDGDEEKGKVDLAAAKKAHTATKKTIPLYIGLATGFCGSFTSFSSFIRDVFLALSNDLPTPLNHPADYGAVQASTNSTVPRNGGYSFMALVAVIITTVALCISAVHIGGHLAIATERYIPTLPFRLVRRILDPFVVFLAFGCWLGAVFLAIFPPDRHSGGVEIWRGRAVFALVFAPPGCLLRFYASNLLNSKLPSFPLGTFSVNIFGTIILGMSYDLQHAPYGGVIGCQVLQGIEDGFCGCLTTVSTWVGELSSLKRWHAYRYGTFSVLIALAFLVVIMGSMRWTVGFSELLCTK